MVSTIRKDDVILVSHSIKKSLTPEQVNQVLAMYAGEEESDPSATWNLIVENCIYQVLRP
jgi:hypothetical protein